MTIFARRDLQQLIDDWHVAGPAPALDRIVANINRADIQSIDFEWELVLLAAMSRVGDVTHEPDLGGSARLDFAFAASSSIAVGEIVTISNRGYEADNPVESFYIELFRRIQAKGLSAGGFEVHYESKTVGEWRRRRVKALVPARRDYHLAFDSSFDLFLDAIKTDPAEARGVHLVGTNWNVRVSFNPRNRAFVTKGGPTYTISYDAERNPLMQGLKRKAKQLNKVHSPGLKWIIVCDGRSDLLCQQYSYSVGQTRAEDVVSTFFRRNRSVDLVSLATVQMGPPSNLLSTAKGPPTLQLRTFVNPASPRREAARKMSEVAEGLPNVLPPPVTDVANAVIQLGWPHPTEGRPLTGWYWFEWNGQKSGGIVKMGSRTLLELLAGRIDTERFQAQNRNFGVSAESNAFAIMLEQGCMITKIDIEIDAHSDDDVLVFHFGPPDPALSPLRNRR